MTATRLTWARVGDRYPDRKDELNDFLALNGEEEVGLVKLVPTPDGRAEWMWSMLLTHPGPAFPRVTNGQSEDRLQAVRELHECWWAFRKWFEIEE